jgi:hypothetical protein
MGGEPVPTLLSYEGGQWYRQAVPRDADYAILGSGAGQVTVGHGRVGELPADLAGVIMFCDGQPYYLSVPDSAPYLNAEPRQLMMHRLRDRDRLTFHFADRGIVRVWYLHWDSELPPRCDGTPAGLACGYCGVVFALGEEMIACAACGEVVHTDCLAHGGNRCPRCDAVLTNHGGPWFPDGFPDEIIEEDDDE